MTNIIEGTKGSITKDAEPDIYEEKVIYRCSKCKATINTIEVKPLKYCYRCHAKESYKLEE